MVSRAATLVAVTSGGFASAVMQTVLATATPRVVAELGDPVLYPWVAGGYLLASALTIPVSGQYADRLGPRRVLAVGSATYLAATVLVALAPTMPALVAARVLQGVGAGAVVPAGLAAVGLLFDEAERGRAVGLLGGVQLVAQVVGPLWGGWAADGPGWRWGLVAAVPVLLGGLVAARGVPTAAAPPRWWRVRPLDPFRLLRGPLAVPVAGAVLVGAVTMALLTYVPLALQDRHGGSASATGRTLVALLVAAAVGLLAAGRLARYRWVPLAGWALTVTGAATVAAVGAAPGVVVVVGLALVGVGSGALVPLLLLQAQAVSGRDTLAQASGLVQLGRTAGPAVAVPLLGGWLVTGWPLPTSLDALLWSVVAVAAAGLGLALARPAPR